MKMFAKQDESRTTFTARRFKSAIMAPVMVILGLILSQEVLAHPPGRNCHAADFDQDGEVGIADLAEILKNWGETYHWDPNDPYRPGSPGIPAEIVSQEEWDESGCDLPKEERPITSFCDFRATPPRPESGTCWLGPVGSYKVNIEYCKYIPPSRYDIHPNGLVDISDLGFVLTFWGGCS